MTKKPRPRSASILDTYDEYLQVTGEPIASAILTQVEYLTYILDAEDAESAAGAIVDALDNITMQTENVVNGLEKLTDEITSLKADK